MRLPPDEYRKLCAESGYPIVARATNGRRRRLKRRLWKKFFGESSTGKCHWCCCDLGKLEATTDHEPALSEGGTFEQAVIACFECNEKRARETEIRVKAKRGEYYRKANGM